MKTAGWLGASCSLSALGRSHWQITSENLVKKAAGLIQAIDLRHEWMRKEAKEFILWDAPKLNKFYVNLTSFFIKKRMFWKILERENENWPPFFLQVLHTSNHSGHALHRFFPTLFSSKYFLISSSIFTFRVVEKTFIQVLKWTFLDSFHQWKKILWQ